MSNLVDFSAEIKSILQAVQQGGSAAFVEVVEYPTNEFSGHPSATITPSGVSSSFITVAQNQRSYGFTIDLYYAIEKDAVWATAFDTMRSLVDACLDALDRANNNAPSGGADLNGLCDFLQAVPMDWSVEEAGQGYALVASIALVAVKDVDIH